MWVAIRALVPLTFDPVPSQQDKKPRQIEIDISNGPNGRAIYANAYSLERNDDHVVFYFAFQSDETGVTTRVTGASVSVSDLLNQASNWKKYLEQVAPLIESFGQFKRPCRGLSNVEFIEAANVIQMSRMGWTAEIAFSFFVLHELVLWREGSPQVVAQRNLSVRCSLHMQTDLLFKLLDLIEPDQQGEES